MKTNYFLAVLFSLAVLNVHAQFTDDMESYTPGEPISGGHWGDWGCGGGPGCAMMSSDAEAQSGLLSGLIPDDGTTDAALDLGNKIFSEWGLSFWMYVPSNNEAYWKILGCVPICSQDWGFEFFFNQNNNNPGMGLVHNTALGDLPFNFPHDQWFRIVLLVDISTGIALATWQLYIDGVEIVPCETPFTDEVGDINTSLGGIEFFSISLNNTYYVDTFEYIELMNSCILGVEEHIEPSIDIYPNPVKDILRIDTSSKTEITSFKIYDVLGRLVLTKKGNVDMIDVSQLNSGVLFVEIETHQGIVTKKVIKN